MATATDIVNNTAAFIEAAQSTANAAINTLNTAASGWSVASWSDLVAPDLGTYTTFAEGDAAVKLALDAFDNALAALPPPTALPAAPALTGYDSPLWNDNTWTSLKSLLTQFTGNITNSDDLDSVIVKLTSETTRMQNAMFAQDLERRQKILRDANSAANAATAARGFNYPNSMTVALKLSAQQEYMFGLSQVSRDLIKMLFEWAKSNYQFSVEKQIAAHQSDADFNLRYAETLVRVYDTEVRAILSAYRDMVAAEISKAEQKIKNYATRLEAIKTNAGIVAEQDRFKVQNFATEVQQHISSVGKAVETASSNAKNKIDAAVAAVNAAANMVSSASQISIGILNG